MVKKDISPEERLLSLIKSKNKKAVAITAPQDPPKEASDQTVISKADERLDGMLRSELFKNKLFEPSTLKNVNRYLVVILAVLTLYFVIDLIFVRPYKNVQSIVAKAGTDKDEKKFVPETTKIAAMKDYSSYSGAMPGKTAFGQSQLGAGASAEEVGASGDNPGQVGLVGIIAGDNPQAIIEDKKAQKTYYLNKGQSFNGYIVEEILKDKVILDYEGRKISLFL